MVSVVYGMKMAFTVYLHMFCVHHTRAVYNIVHLFLVVGEVISGIFIISSMESIINSESNNAGEEMCDYSRQL